MKTILRCINVLVIAWHTSGFGFCESDFKVAIHAGLAPTAWIQRGQLTAISCNSTTVLGLSSAVIPLFDMPQYHSLFKVPWIVGASVYADFDSDVEWYIQTNYRSGSARVFTIPTLVIPHIDTISLSIAPHNNYQAIDAFLGIQRASSYSCYDVLLWYGLKAGLIYRKKVDAVFITQSLTVPFEYQTTKQNVFKKSINPAVGVTFGCEGNICKNILWNLRFELVAACGPRLNQYIPFDFGTQSVLINPLLAPNGFIFNGIGTEFYFPITFGFKFAH